MAINLQKGQTVDLDPAAGDLSSVTLGLGWKIRRKGGLLGRLFGDDYDLDAIAVVLDENEKIRNLGDQQLEGSDVIFFNNLRHHTGHIVHTGDSVTGGKGVRDDEQIVVKLDSLTGDVHRILFLVCIYQGIRKKQHFGEVEKAFIRAVDGNGREMARYDLADDPSYDNMRTMSFGEVCRHDGGWKFRAIGEGFPTDQWTSLLSSYVDQ